MKDAEIHGKDSSGNIRPIRVGTDGKIGIGAGGIARTANPTAVADGADVSPSFDDLGRQLTRPYQARDLISTAYASLTTGTKTSLIAGVASTYLDLCQITCANNSDAAAIVTLTDESTTVRSISVPANGVTHLNFQIPLKQSALGVAWYVDLPDITGTTIEVTAEFAQEV